MKKKKLLKMGNYDSIDNKFKQQIKKMNLYNSFTEENKKI